MLANQKDDEQRGQQDADNREQIGDGDAPGCRLLAVMFGRSDHLSFYRCAKKRGDLPGHQSQLQIRGCNFDQLDAKRSK